MLVLSLLAAELVLRSATRVLGSAGEFAGILEEDGRGGLRTVPGFRGEITFDDRKIPTRINNAGLRGADIGPKTGPRVLMLGDSMVFGYGVEDTDALPAALARDLSAALGVEVEVGNGGIPGFGTHDQIMVLERFLDTFDPDVVVSCIYVGNDFVDDTRIHKIVYNGYVLEGPVARMAENSLRVRLALRFRVFYALEKLYEWLVPSMSVDRLGRGYATPEDLEAAAGLPPVPMQEYGLFMDVAEDNELTARVQGKLTATLEQLAALAGERPLLVVVLPTWVHVLDDLWAFELADQGWPQDQMVRGRSCARVVAACRQLGLPVIDLYPLMKAEPEPRRLYHAGDFHFSASGNARIAEWLAPRVEALLDAERGPEPPR